MGQVVEERKTQMNERVKSAAVLSPSPHLPELLAIFWGEVLSQHRRSSRFESPLHVRSKIMMTEYESVVYYIFTAILQSEHLYCFDSIRPIDSLLVCKCVNTVPTFNTFLKCILIHVSLDILYEAQAVRGPTLDVCFLEGSWIKGLEDC